MAEEGGTNTTGGTVLEVLPDSLFRVQLHPTPEVGSSAEDVGAASNEVSEGQIVLAYLAGKMRLHRIRVLVGDEVEMVLDPYGGRARIVRRLT